VTVHDSVSVSVIVSEIWPFEKIPSNVCRGRKSRSRSFEVTVGASAKYEVCQFLKRNIARFREVPEIMSENSEHKAKFGAD